MVAQFRLQCARDLATFLGRAEEQAWRGHTSHVPTLARWPAGEWSTPGMANYRRDTDFPPPSQHAGDLSQRPSAASVLERPDPDSGPSLRGVYGGQGGTGG